MSSNTETGKQFQLLARDALSRDMGINLEMEVKIPIGSPPKSHTFDLASADRAYVGECKAFTWTATGNVPSAKISNLREALTYLNQLPAPTNKFIVMKRDIHPVKRQSLADYFVRLNPHLIGSVCIVELAEEGTIPRIVCGTYR